MKPDVDPIEEAMCSMPQAPDPDLSDEEALALLADPEGHAGGAPGLKKWVRARPGGAEAWRGWLEEIRQLQIAARKG